MVVGGGSDWSVDVVWFENREVVEVSMRFCVFYSYDIPRYCEL